MVVRPPEEMTHMKSNIYNKTEMQSKKNGFSDKQIFKKNK